MGILICQAPNCSKPLPKGHRKYCGNTCSKRAGYWRNKGVSPPTWTPGERECARPGCSNTFVPTRENNIYCSSKCGNKVAKKAYRKSSPARYTPKTYEPVKCAYGPCANVFTPKASDNRFCSEECCNKHHQVIRQNRKSENAEWYLCICEDPKCQAEFVTKSTNKRFCSYKCSTSSIDPTQINTIIGQVVECALPGCSERFVAKQEDHIHCSQSCRAKARLRRLRQETPDKWREYRDKENEESRQSRGLDIPRTCKLDGCHVVFSPRRANHIYCSSNCATAASIDRCAQRMQEDTGYRNRRSAEIAAVRTKHNYKRSVREKTKVLLALKEQLLSIPEVAELAKQQGEPLCSE